MRKDDLKLILRYLRRFLERPIFSKQKFSALKRYIVCGFSVIGESIMGLDYTMVFYTKNESTHNSVYTKAPKHVLKRIFRDISFQNRKNFLDVGCGKGYVLNQAFKYPFGKVGGVEYTEDLYKTCCKNLKRKKLDSGNVVNCDARAFEEYGDYTVFFMNNPFDETILKEVAKKINDAHMDDRCWIYYLNPSSIEREEAILNAGFKLVRKIADPNESYFMVYVYSNKKS